MIAFGIGARSTATVSDLARAMSEIITAHDIRPDAIATLEGAAFIDQLRDLGETAGAIVVTLSKPMLASRANGCTTWSTRSMAATGIPSISEAAALAAAGSQSTLIVPRRVVGLVTIAVARSATHPERLS